MGRVERCPGGAAGLHEAVGVPHHVGPIEGLLQQAPSAAHTLVGGGMGGLDQGGSASAGNVDAVILVHQQVVVLSPAALVDPELEALADQGAGLAVAPTPQAGVRPAHLLAGQRLG